MGISSRWYILQDDGALRRITRKVVDGLTFGTDAIPDYAGTRQRAIQVLVESDGGKPSQILDVTGSFWDFDGEGKVNDSFRRSAAELVELAFAAPTRPQARGAHVVDLVPELKRKQIYAKHRWTVSQQDIDRIAADLWPGVHGPAPAVTPVKGKAPRKPPITIEARKALSEISISLTKINHALEQVSEASLRGLLFEADRQASYEDPALWRGIADHIKARQVLLAAKRTGKGEWYAVVEATRHDNDDTIRTIATAYAKAATRNEAVEAGRLLIAEKASWLAPDVQVAVSIYSALEWQPNDE